MYYKMNSRDTAIVGGGYSAKSIIGGKVDDIFENSGVPVGLCFVSIPGSIKYDHNILNATIHESQELSDEIHDKLYELIESQSSSYIEKPKTTTKKTRKNSASSSQNKKSTKKRINN